MRIAFWGTPDFAVPPLRALIGEGHDVVCVITQPDRPRGRSRSHPEPPPVKTVATSEAIPVLQPTKLRTPEFAETLRSFEPDVSVVVAYGLILPTDIIELPEHGTLNIHASLLPELRGASPIQGAILGGFTETGITIMKMVRELDAGDILHVARTPILDDETFGELHERLSELGALAIVQALALLEAGAAIGVPQDHARATFTRKITRETTRLSFRNSATEVARSIRAFDPQPGALTALRGTDVKCFGAHVVGDGSDDAIDTPTRLSDPGTIRIIDADGMIVRCRTGAVRLSMVQPAGKARISPADWERGRGVRAGDMLE